MTDLNRIGYSCKSSFNITTGPKTTSFSHMPPNILACKSVIFPALVNEVYDPPTSSELCIAHDVSSCRRSSFLDGKSNDVVVQSSIEHKEVKWESEELWRTDTWFLWFLGFFDFLDRWSGVDNDFANSCKKKSKNWMHRSYIFEQ